MPVTDRIASVFILLITVFLYSLAADFRGEAGFFPKIILGGIAFLAVLLFFNSLYVQNKMKKAGQTVPSPSLRDLLAGKGGLRNFLFCAAGTIAYVFLIPVLGFYVATYIFICALFMYFNLKNKMALSLVPLASVAILYLVFTAWLSVPVPTGILL